MIDILSSCTSGGCGAKIGPGELKTILKNIPVVASTNLIVGYDSSDDAAVYKIDDKQSIIATMDFFSPMVNDPKTFGKIAAANALSDVYAMGGKPILALNMVCFPEKLEKDILGEILAGGAEKLQEADVVLGGGHSIYDKEPKYGLSVTGIIDNDKIIRNNTPRIGDSLILTKPLGVGIIMAAVRGELASDETIKKATDSMAHLNKYSGEKMLNYNVSACTDVTGFGLAAHLMEMCDNNVTAQINIDDLPVIPEAIDFANDYIITAAGQRNRNHFDKDKDPQLSSLPFAIQELLFDPQTSGGLLICVESSQADELLADIKKDDPAAAIIGEILPKDNNKIIFSQEA